MRPHFVASEKAGWQVGLSGLKFLLVGVMQRIFCCAVFAFFLSGCEGEDVKVCTDAEALITPDYSTPQKSKSGLPILRQGVEPVVANTKNSAAICVKEWGWKLAKSQGSNEELAEAVLRACQTKIDAVADLPRITFDNSLEAETAYKKANADEYKSKAMFRVIQGRSGHCKFKP